jgi:Arm DNA-binding domain
MTTVLLTDIRVRQLKASDVQVTYWDTQLRGFGVRVGRQRKTWLVMRGKKRTRVTLGHYPQLGLSEARKKAMAALGETPTTIANRMNFETALEKFVTQHCEPNYKPRSRYQVERTLRRYFLPLFAKTSLHKIADRDIGDVLEKMSKTPSEANHAFAHVRTFFRWCAKPPRRYVQHSPCEGMEMPYRTTARKRVLTDAELKAVWGAADRAGYPFGAQAPTGDITANPAVLKSGSKSSISWSAQSVSSCTISGTNGDGWGCTDPGSCAATSTRTSSDILGQTTYTLKCVSLDGSNFPPRSAIVTIVPISQEK